MPKDTPPELRQSESKYLGNDDQLLAEAMRFFQRLNESARNTQQTLPLEGKALEALKSFQNTAARLEVLKSQ